MSKTLRGVYHNLEDSTYIATNGELNLFFSSTAKLGKFLVNYQGKRQFMKNKIDRFIGEMKIRQELLADVLFYEQVEKGGGYCTLNGKRLSTTELEKYIASFFSNDKTLEYYVVSNPEEIKQIRSTIKLENGVNE